MGDFLKDIIEYKKKLNQRKRALYESLKQKAQHEPMTRYRLFQRALKRPDRPAIIAEIKKASPSKGVLRKDFNAVVLAQAYERGGADALSVLTEDRFFLGRPAYLKKVAAQVSLPVLAKDFFIDPGQVYQAYACGASAVLVILAVVDDATARSLMETAAHLDMDALVEVHTYKELQRALDLNASIIGVNARDLHTFEVDTKKAARLLSKIPDSIVKVFESGVTGPQDIAAVGREGADAVLIGEALMRQTDVETVLKQWVQKLDQLIKG